MWNPEARDSSPIIRTFMSSWERTKRPPLLGRRRTRSNRAGKIHCGGGFRLLLSGRCLRSRRCREGGGQGGTLLPGKRRQGIGVRENTLRWRISPRYSVDYRRRGQGVAERQNPLRRGMSLGSSKRSRKNRSIRGFRVSLQACVHIRFF